MGWNIFRVFCNEFFKKIQINQNQNEIQKSTITFGMLKIKINSTFLKNENIKR